MKNLILSIVVFFIVMIWAYPVIAETNVVADDKIHLLWQRDAMLQTNISVVNLYDADGRLTAKIMERNGRISAQTTNDAFVGAVISRGDTFTFLNAYNQYDGKAVSTSKQVLFYDEKGAFSGKAVRSGRNTYFYDNRGRYIGKSVRDSSGNIRFYDKLGVPKGKVGP